MRDVDVVVAGAGATGCAVAWKLACRGADVLLLDEAERGTGGSRAFRVAQADLTDVSLALQALPLWRELEQGTGARVLELTGEVSHGRSAELDLKAWAVDAAGKPGRWLPHDEAVERWPGIRYDERIFFHPLAGRLDADAAVTAMRAAAGHAGTAVRFGSVTGVEPEGEDAVTVRTTDGPFRARRAVLTAPARTEAGVHLPPVRDGLAWPVFAHYSENAVLATGMAADGGVSVLGEDPDAYARRWLPGADVEAAETRHTESGREFRLERHGPVVRAAGFTGDGFGFLPAIGRLVADLTLTGAHQES